MLVLPLPRPAYAFDWPRDWNSLWKNENQRAQQAMQANSPGQAAGLFKDPEWRAAANYRAGNFQEAVKSLEGVDGIDARYNRGNALAKLGQFQQALQAYDDVLKRDSKNADAKFNRDLVEELLKQQEQRQQNKDGQKGDKQDQKQQSSDQDKHDKNGQQDSKSGDQQDSGQQGDRQQGDADSKNRQQDQGKQDAASDAKDGQQGKQGNKDQQHAANDGEEKNQDGKREAGQQQNAESGSGQQDENRDKGDKVDGGVEGSRDANQLQQADRQWLRRIPDDPGGLWRRKFLYQYQQQQRRSEDKTW
jgi:Ca-activated chloride channel family protein